jgi:hypothetical protein
MAPYAPVGQPYSAYGPGYGGWPGAGAGGYGAGPYGYYPPFQQPMATRNGPGVASLVLSIIGLLVCWTGLGWILSVLGIIFGHIGLSAAKQGQADNRGMSVAGLVMGYIGLGLLVLGVLFLVAVLGGLFSWSALYSDYIVYAIPHLAG